MLRNYYITGDTHGSFGHIEKFCNRFSTTKDDVLIILGDVGLNYYDNYEDIARKRFIDDLPITLFCIRGNHEFRPIYLPYIEYTVFGETDSYALYEPEFDNIIYAIDNTVYTFNNKKYYVVGGAYSVDKYYRLENDMLWFEDEQCSFEESLHVIAMSKSLDGVHGILTHTCPLRYIPTEWFLSQVDQSTVDKGMELLFDRVYENLNHNVWYCGHYHGEKVIDKMRFLYHSIEILQ